jgi:hypothetical protein
MSSLFRKLFGTWGKSKSKTPPQPQMIEMKELPKRVDPMVKFHELRKAEQQQELAALRGGGPLSAGGKNVLGYATGLLAQSRKKGRDDPTDQTFKHLRVGSDAMDYTRNKLNKGRGNVDANDPAFPEAYYRTKVGYAGPPLDFTNFAAKAELLRAGNCDMHAAMTYNYAGGHLDDEGVAAKVVHPGHTFSELRAKNGKTQVSPKDVIVDSWAGGEHAVLRKDSYFATAISPSSDHNLHPDHTQATTTKQPGLADFQRKEHLVSNPQNQNFQQFHDIEAAKPQNRVDPSNPITQGMWQETPIMSPMGDSATAKREKTFNEGSQMLRHLQTVYTARKMGASIGDAAKLIKK